MINTHLHAFTIIIKTVLPMSKQIIKMISSAQLDVNEWVKRENKKVLEKALVWETWFRWFRVWANMARYYLHFPHRNVQRVYSFAILIGRRNIRRQKYSKVSQRNVEKIKRTCRQPHWHMYVSLSQRNRKEILLFCWVCNQNII